MGMERREEGKERKKGGGQKGPFLSFHPAESSDGVSAYVDRYGMTRPTYTSPATHVSAFLLPLLFLGANQSARPVQAAPRFSAGPRAFFTYFVPIFYLVALHEYIATYVINDGRKGRVSSLSCADPKGILVACESEPLRVPHRALFCQLRCRCEVHVLMFRVASQRLDSSLSVESLPVNFI